jgi:hypothetical protein
MAKSTTYHAKTGNEIWSRDQARSPREPHRAAGDMAIPGTCLRDTALAKQLHKG